MSQLTIYIRHTIIMLKYYLIHINYLICQFTILDIKLKKYLKKKNLLRNKNK